MATKVRRKVFTSPMKKWATETAMMSPVRSVARKFRVVRPRVMLRAPYRMAAVA
jgi:hypothetical protein